MTLDSNLEPSNDFTISSHDHIVRPGRRGVAEFGRHLGRITRAALGAELLPAFLRTKALVLLGADIHHTTCIWSGCSFRSTNLDFGPRVFINVGFFFDGVARLTIEADVRIGQFVRVLTGSHDIGPPTQRCLLDVVAAPVRIERGCWIGAGSIILPGVTIARGCVIAAGSIVLKSTSPDGLYAGNPARLIRKLPMVQ